MTSSTDAISRLRLNRALLGGASLSVLLLAGPAMAQQAADDSLETVVVTGTLLRGINPVGTNIVTFNSADIAATGAVTANQVLSNIPQISNNFNVDPATGVGLAASTGSGTAIRPKIRNLGITGGGAATLVLINGHNAVGEGLISTTPDGGAIPGLVLQRVDVVPDGGSALYGSDAVAGIVNFITRSSYEGFQAETHIGTTGNYDSFQLGMIGGHGWGSGNVMLAYEYRNNSNQLWADRPYGRLNLIPLGGTADTRSTACPLANVVAGGTTFALNSNTVANAPGALKTSAVVGQNKCDTYLNQSSFPQESDHSFFGTVNQQISDGVNFTMTAEYSSRATTALATAPSATSQVITNANPFFQSINGETRQTVSFSFAPFTGNSVNSTALLNQYEVEPELKVALGGDWNLDLFGNYGRSDVKIQSYSASPGVLTNALVSSDPNYALDPYNLGMTNANTLQSLTQFGNYARAAQQLEQLRVQADGSLFSLPGGDVRLATGGEYRYESIRGENVNGPIGQTTGNAVPGGLFVRGNAHRYVESAFGELLVPLIGSGNTLSFVQEANLDISGRWDHYSDFGSTTNPKVGLTVKPFADLTLRGNFGKSFNAPSLADGSQALDTRVGLQSTSTVRVPVSVSGVSPGTDVIDAQRPSFQIAGGTGNLQPQTANTYSYGFDYQPDFVDGLTLSLTKWHVSLYHIIGTPPYSNGPVLFSTPAYSRFYILHPSEAQAIAATQGLQLSGFLNFDQPYQNGANSTPYALVDARRYNLGNQFDDGVDFNVEYTMPTSFGSADIGVAGTDFTSNLLQAFAGAVKTDNLAANFSPYQFSAHLGAQAGPLSGRLSMNYSAGFTVTGIPNQTHVGAFMPVSLFLNYDLDNTWSMLQGTSASLNINNLFDTNPPFFNSTSGLSNGGAGISGIANGSTLGRYFEIGLAKKF